MRYIIDDAIVTQENIVVTPKQSAVVQMFHCYAKGISVSLDKPTIQAAGSEFATLSFAWQYFDVEAGDYVPDLSNDGEITVRVSGTDYIITPMGGVATLEFDAELAGEYIFETVNAEVKNASVKVVAV